MNIFVGNLSRDVTNDDLLEAFKAFGETTSANVIRDKFSGDSRGFGFVEMPSTEQAQAAITALNGTEWERRTLTVNEARPRADRGGMGGGGSRERRGGGGFGGRGDRGGRY